MKRNNNCLEALNLCIILILLYSNAYAQTSREVSGNITTNTTWSDDTIKVTGNVVISQNVILTISPGTHVKFQGNYGIEINGYLIAEGLPGDTIIFTRTDTLGFSDFSNNQGGWKGLAFMSGGAHTDTSRLSICKISFVKCVENHYGAIYIFDAHKLKITDCLIENNYGEKGAGINSSGFMGAETLIKDCLIKNNFASERGGGIFGTQKTRIVHNVISNNHCDQEGGGIYLSYCEELVTGNIIKNNYAGSGGGIRVNYGSPRVEGNIFEYNQVAGGGGGLYCSNFSKMKIISNRFTNNTGGGIYIISSEPEIINNIINNNEGGGVIINDSDVKIVNNTICYNHSGSGGGLNCMNSTSILINNIIWNNEANQIYIQDNFSSPDIYYSALHDGIGGIGLNPGTVYQGNYQNNIESNPLFADPAPATGVHPDAPDADWSILTYSPCVNAGNPDVTGLNIPMYDIMGNDRISHGRIDMGAIETLISKISVGGIIPSDSALVADTVEVTGDIIIPDGVTLTIAPGTKVLFKGHFKIDVKGRLLAQGSKSDTICFAVKDTSGFSDFESIDGAWDGICFDNGILGANGAMNDNDSSLFSYCHISYAKTNTSGGGAFFLNHFSKVRIEHCVIENNGAVNFGGGGLFLDYSSPFINFCRISKNFSTYSAAGIYSNNSDFILTNSIIDQNIIEKDSYGAAIHLRRSSPQIRNCDIAYNYNESGLRLENSDPVIMNCRICNNISNYFWQASAIDCQYGRPLLINNLIANNSEYAMRFRNVEGAILINNTIVNNLNKGLTFDNSVSHIYNTIFWGNTSGQISFEETVGTVNDINFYHCIIENGISTTYFNKGYIKDYVENMYVSPGFIQPTTGAGNDYDGLSANWVVDNFSPCINSGTINIPDIALPSTDLAGGPRINSTTIDIGAYEHQGAPVVITINPNGGSKCEGDSITFHIEVDDQVTFQWQRNNIVIPGADNSYLSINPVTPADEGVYRCIVSNAYGTTSSGDAYLIVKSPPEILTEPSSSWFEISKTVNLSVIVTGSIPMVYQWQKDGENISGAKSPDYIIPKVAYSDEGEYSLEISNSCGEVETNPAILYLAPQICMVTVSIISGNNLVIWEKKSRAPLTAYNIYRESTAAGIYDLLSTIPYSNLSLYEDPTADPTKRAYIYKITGITASGFETDLDLCKSHKTIHLIVSTNPELNTTQLQWDKYFGFDYQTYTIYKSSTGANFDFADAMPATLSSWTETNPAEGDVFYRISVEKPDPCFPSGAGKKADTGPYSHSMSNIDDNRLQAGENPPDTVMLTNASIAENNMYGMLIGRLRTIDKDTLDTHIYSLVDGEGSDDNLSFTILGDMLLAADIFDYELKDNYSVRIRCTDKGNLTREQVFIILINDVDETVGMDGPVINKLRIYPNPFSEITTIRFDNPEGSAYRMYVTDLTGKVVYSEDNIFTSRVEFNREGLPEGYYFVELRGERLFRGRMVLQ